MKKKHGWVIQEETQEFVHQDGIDYTEQLCNALVFDTRAGARQDSAECVMFPVREVVRKVSLTLKGKAKKIIGRG